MWGLQPQARLSHPCEFKTRSFSAPRERFMKATSPLPRRKVYRDSSSVIFCKSSRQETAPRYPSTDFVEHSILKYFVVELCDFSRLVNKHTFFFRKCCALFFTFLSGWPSPLRMVGIKRD